MQENKDGYRPNVAMVVINSEKGIDLSKKEYKNMAISQRGIDRGEDIKNAMYRELLKKWVLKKKR